MADTSRNTLICRIVYSTCGIVIGVSVFICWLVLFDSTSSNGSLHTVAVGGLSGAIAAWNLVTHVMHIQDLWRTWLKGLRYFMLFGGIFIVASAVALITYIALAAAQKQSLTVDSYYITAVWCFICLKWSVLLLHHSRGYRNEFADLNVLLEF